MPSYSPGIHFTNQVLRGARRPATIKTYVYGLVQTPSTIFLHGDGLVVDETNYNTETNPARAHIISLAGGSIEFDGYSFELDTNTFNNHINLDLIANLLCPDRGGSPEYILAAVPMYDEPISKAEAIERGLDWYLQLSPSGEWVAKYFMGEDCDGALGCAGGFQQLEKLVLSGCATCEQQKAYYRCAEALQKMGMPNCHSDMLCIKGVNYVLFETTPQSNRCCNVGDLTSCDWQELAATSGTMAGRTLMPSPDSAVDPVTTEGYYTIGLSSGGPWEFYTSNSSFHQGVGSDYGDGNGPGTDLSRLHSITIYRDIDAAMECRDARVLMYPSSVEEIDRFITKLTTPLPADPCEEPCGLGWDPDTLVTSVKEFEVCCSLPVGQRGDHPHIRKTITKRDATVPFLGLVNPIYFEDLGMSLRVPKPMSTGSALTYYADPVPLFRFRLEDVDKTVDPPTVTIDLESIVPMWGYMSGASYTNP